MRDEPCRGAVRCGAATGTRKPGRGVDVCPVPVRGIPDGVNRPPVIAPILSVVVLVAFAAGCDDDPHGAGGIGGVGGRVVTGDLAGRHDAVLDVVSGADTVTVRAADLGDDLFRASAPAGARVVPVADVTDSAVRLSLTDSGAAGGADVVVELNTSVAWRIRLDGGAKQATVAMGGGRLSELSFGAGNSRIEVDLPAPRGTVPVRMAGGASVFDLRLPRDVPAQVRIAGGAGSATIDGTVHTGIPGGTVYTADDWNAATDRYLIDNTAGVSALTLGRTTR
jgi:hypothetical protein